MSQSRTSAPQILVLLLLLGVSVGPAAAQEPSGTPDSGIREEVSVYLVEVEILALDKKGDPVTDLRPEELVIKERGKPQEISVFERHLREAPEGPIPDARIHFSAPDGRQPRQTAGVEPRWFVLYFDLVHGDLRTRVRLHEAAREFVETRLPQDGMVAVVSFTGDVNLEQNFTDDRESLKVAVEQAFSRPALAISWEQRMRELLFITKDCQQQMVQSRTFRPGEECMVAAVRNYLKELEPTTRKFIDGLDTMARLLSGVDGRKYLFMFTHGVSLEPIYEAVSAVEAFAGASYQLEALRFELMDEVEFRRDYYAAVERAIRGDVTVFTLDGSPQPTADTDLSRRGEFRRAARPYARAFEEAREGLDELSRSTGGMFFGSSDFLTNLDRALRATEGAYTVGYYSDLGRVKNPRDYVKVGVKSSRRGVTITSRNGFYYQPQTGDANLGQLDLQAEQVAGDKRLVPFAVTLNPLNFELIRSEAEVAMNFTMHLRLLTDRGATVADSFHFLSHAYDRDIYDSGTVIAPRYEGFLELDPGDYLFQVVIRDPQEFRYAELVEQVHASAARDAASPAAGGAE